MLLFDFLVRGIVYIYDSFHKYEYMYSYKQICVLKTSTASRSRFPKLLFYDLTASDLQLMFTCI